jgi:hypothetical protein
MGKTDFLKSFKTLYDNNYNPTFCYGRITDKNEKQIETLQDIIKSSYITKILQGIVNIGIDDDLQVFARYKLYRCVFDKSASFTIPFPLTKGMYNYIQWFFCYIKNIIDKNEFDIWSSTYLKRQVFRGRKRKINNSLHQIYWLLNEECENKVFESVKYFRISFGYEECDLIDKLINSFGIN